LNSSLGTFNQRTWCCKRWEGLLRWNFSSVEVSRSLAIRCPGGWFHLWRLWWMCSQLVDTRSYQSLL